MAKATVDCESDGRGRLMCTNFSANFLLLASVASKKNNESKQTDQIFKSSSTKFAHLVAKARWSVRRKGDWKEIAKLKAKYSILDLPLPAASCAAAVSFVATLFAGVDLQGSDGRGVSQLPICADTPLFLLNECSLSQNECLWPLQTNFYRTFGRFVSALISIPIGTERANSIEHKKTTLKCEGGHVASKGQVLGLFLLFSFYFEEKKMLTWAQVNTNTKKTLDSNFTHKFCRIRIHNRTMG